MPLRMFLADALNGMAPAAQVLVLAIPLAAIVVAGVLGFFSLFWDHQRRLMIIKQGGTPPDRDFSDRLFLFGLVSAFVGCCLVVFFWITKGVGDILLIGIIPAAAAGTVTIELAKMTGMTPPVLTLSGR